VNGIRRLRLGLVAVLAVVLQTTLFADLRLFGVAPDLPLVLVIAVAYREGPQTGAVYGFWCGLAIDLFLQTPFGLSALAFSAVGYAVGGLRTGMTHASPWAPMVFGGFGGLAGGALFVVVGILAGQEQLVAARTVPVVLAAAAYDALLALPVFPLGRWAAHSSESRVRGPLAG
jgi:rod shape-determining protein MreD